MSNPPPVRPWFRLTSIRPVPTPAPEPRPSLPLPTFRTSSAPSSPQIQPTQQPQPQEKTTQPPPSSPPRKIVSTSLPSSPLRKAPPFSSSSPPRNPRPPPPPPSPSSSSSSPQKKNSPINHVLPSPTPHQSPKTIRQSDLSPMNSPKSKLSARPPSPLTLPPSQLKTEEPNVPAEAESKAVLVQKTIDKPKAWHHNNGSGEHHRETKNHGNPHHGKHVARREGEAKERTRVSDSEDSGMRVITIAGENRGAFMELIQSPNKKESHYLHKKGGEHVKVDGGGLSESSGAEEGNAKKKDKNQKGRTGSSSSIPMTAYMNSNVQCVNNSLLYHTSCSHHDPGVRLSLTKKPIGEGYYLKEHVDGKNK